MSTLTLTLQQAAAFGPVAAALDKNPADEAALDRAVDALLAAFDDEDDDSYDDDSYDDESAAPPAVCWLHMRQSPSTR